VPEEHRIYLADRVRLDAYRRALEATVRPGSVVLDLGAGTGILGLLACRAGAGRVYAVDEGPILETARRAAAANGFGDRVRCVRGMSTRIDLPEKVDLVVADLVGGFGFETGILDYFRDARERFLRPGGTLVPEAVTVEMAPVEAPSLYAEVEFWGSRPAGFDFAAARSATASTPLWGKLAPGDLLGPPAELRTLEFLTAGPDPIAAELDLGVRRPGVLHGIGGWFRARLAPGVEMTTSPLAAERIDRRNVLLPIETPVPVRAGDRVRVRVNYLPAQFLVAWRGTVEDAGGAVRARFSQSSLDGTPLTRADLRDYRPDRRPRLDAWGEAWREALRLCDGRHEVEEIRTALLAGFPALFRSPPDVEAFVAEVLRTASAPPGAGEPGAP